MSNARTSLLEGLRGLVSPRSSAAGLRVFLTRFADRRASLAVAFGACLPALPAIAQAAGPRDSNPIVTFLIVWFPILLILGIWFWFMRRLGASRYKDHIQRSVEHMDRVEQQNLEILSTLRSIESELKNRDL